MTFDTWFLKNKDELSLLLRNDELEALYKAWFAGYEAGLAAMSNFAQDIWN